MPYAAFVKSPLNEDGTSVFKSRRAVLPLKFTLTEDNLPTCALPAAKISVVRTAGGPFELIDVNAFRASGESGPNLRIDQATCQYNYNLAASSLGRGTYTVEVRIKGLLAGKAIFTLE
jgi:hypothetical protein